MTRTSNVKTNINFARNPAALALITPDDVSLNYYFQGREFALTGSGLADALDAGIECGLQAVLNQCRLNRCNLIIILSAQLTLFSEQQFPPGLSEAQIDDLFKLQLSDRTGTAGITTFYDYFPLKKSASACTYGLVEARKDVLGKWITIFEQHGHHPVAVLSQPIVLINHILKNYEFGSQKQVIVCILPARIFIFFVNKKQVEKITEHATSTDSGKLGSIVNTIDRHLDEGAGWADHPTQIFDAVDSGMDDDPGNDIRIWHILDQEQVPGENTFKWIRADYDFYQSVALA